VSGDFRIGFAEYLAILLFLAASAITMTPRLQNAWAASIAWLLTLVFALFLAHEHWNDLMRLTAYYPIRSLIVAMTSAAAIVGMVWHVVVVPFAERAAPSSGQQQPASSPSASETAREVTKALPLPQSPSRPELPKSIPKIHPEFAATPLLTEERKQRITADVNRFYEYLVGIGYEPPTKTPVFGVSATNTAYSSSTEPGSNVETKILIARNRLDAPNGVIWQYAHWIFARFFPLVPVTPQTRFNGEFREIYAFYYAASSIGEYKPSTGSVFWDWANALWDIRGKYGKDVADRLLNYMYAAWYPPQDGVEFEDFIWLRFTHGLSLIDNNREITSDVIALANARGLPRRQETKSP